MAPAQSKNLGKVYEDFLFGGYTDELFGPPFPSSTTSSSSSSSRDFFSEAAEVFLPMLPAMAVMPAAAALVPSVYYNTVFI